MPINKTQLFALHKSKPEIQKLKTTLHQISSQPNLETNLLQEAYASANLGLLDEAEKKCKTYLHSHNPDAEAYFILGSIAHARNLATIAENYFLETIKLNPRHYEALIYLALISETRGDTLGSSLYREQAKKAERASL